MNNDRELNTRLVEVYGQLEQLCNQIYRDRHGVTDYINDMERYGARAHLMVPLWEDSYQRLRAIRHKRNQLSHGEVSFDLPYATEADIDFIVRFRQIILNQQDPITRYRHILYQQEGQRTRPSTASRATPQITPLQSASEKPNRRLAPDGGGIVLAVVWAVIFLLVIGALIYGFSHS